jgi:hypothetical protein
VSGKAGSALFSAPRPLKDTKMVTTDTQNMRDLEQWVCWRYEERNGKPSKVPYSALTGERASSTNPTSWSGYFKAVAAYRERSYDGIGLCSRKTTPSAAWTWTVA